jgi:hypothetical protein
MSPTRNPSIDPNALDRASFYIEDLKYGPGPGPVEHLTRDQLTGQLEVLLRDAGITSMTGAELREAMEFYGESLAESFRAPRLLTFSCWVDGVMHGIALAAGIEGEHRQAKAARQ